MTRKDNRSEHAAELRRQAEEIILEKTAPLPENPESMTPEEIRRQFHELRVHQIELEMQNRELCNAHAELDTAQAHYFDLYNLAPVGYCTLSEKGLILEANLTDNTPVTRILLSDITERKEAEEAIREKVAELERWRSVTLSREDRIGALKSEINELLASQGQPPRYPSEGV